AVDTPGSAGRSISGALDADLGNVALSDARDPFSAQSPRWIDDGSAILGLVSRNGRVEVVRFAVDGDAEPEVIVGGDREVAAFSATSDGSRLACAISDPGTPYEIFACEDGRERRLTFENDAFLETVEVASVEPFETVSSDGETVHGWLMQPPGFST